MAAAFVLQFSSMKTNSNKTDHSSTERAGKAIVRSLPVLLLALLLFTGSLLLHFYLPQMRPYSKALVSANPNADLGLLTVASQHASGAAGTGIEIAQTAAVDKSYFSDALFVGDSITSGLQIYDMFAGFNAIYRVGVNTHNASTDLFYETGDGQQLTLVEAVRHFAPRKLYIMLGTNGINWATTEWLLDGYRQLVATLVAENPDCIIVLQSIPPVTEKKSRDNRGFLKENFDAYNAGVRQIAIDLGVYFLDINSAFSTPDGYLSLDYAAPDGIHFGYDGYQRWYDYLMTHTVQGESVFCIGPDGYLMAAADYVPAGEAA